MQKFINSSEDIFVNNQNSTREQRFEKAARSGKKMDNLEQ